MAEQIGIIVENEANGLARVLTDRKGACGGCSIQDPASATVVCQQVASWRAT